MDQPSFGDFFKAARRILRAKLLRREGELHRQRRRLAFLLLHGEAEQLTFSRDGVLWTCFVDDLGLAPGLFADGAHQLSELRALLAWLRAHGRLAAPRTHAIDVGANIGTTCIPLARETGLKLIAIEPVPQNLALLERNIEQNGLADRVRCVGAAVSANPGKTVMVLEPRNPGGAEVWEGKADQGFGEPAPMIGRVEVPCDGLDELVRAQGIQPEELAFVWCDVQGHEAAVIETGRALWRAGVPFYCELWRRGLEVHGGLDRFIASASASFRSFYLREDLLAAGAAAQPRALDGLRSILDGVKKDHHFTDALFVPGAPEIRRGDDGGSEAPSR